MKRVYKTLVLASILTAFLPACKEIGPDINLKNNAHALADTTYVETPVAAETKNVVIEEFTGVQCTNCPAGHQIIEGLVSANPGKIVAVSLHPNTPLGYPISNLSVTNLIDAKSQALFISFGVSSLPSGMIDRKQFPSEGTIPVDKSTWQSYATTQLGQTTPVNLLL
ncbi:MAG: hypothetical protein JWO06_630, partial [Bacteroidota bacterium]|nr:hypothetical protein [Bacteroidota bacterium]